jgi:putative PEP-CTERM system TPR-repeat lipoprotein
MAQSKLMQQDSVSCISKKPDIMFKISGQRIPFIAVLSAALILILGLPACSKKPTTESLLAEAHQYQDKGDYKAAVIQLKNALQINPNNADARYLLGTIYNLSGDAASAEKELRKALDMGIAPVKVWPELGNALLAQNHPQQILDETKQLDINQAAITTLRGNAYLALGKTQEAKTAFEQALKTSPGYPGALLGMSRQSLTEKNIASATDFTEQAVKQNPQNTDVWLFKGDLLRAQGKVDSALAAYDQVLKLQPDNNAAHLNKAFLEIATDKFTAAKTDIDAARKAHPNNLLVFYTQALLDYRQGKSAAALESLQQVLRAAPDHLPSVLLSGAVQLSLGSLPQAEQNLRKYLEKDPDNLYARKLLTSTLLKSGQTQAAITTLSSVLKDTTQDVQLLSMAGEVYMQAGDYPKATEYFTRASQLSPKAPELHTALGLSKLAQGDSNSATSEMETAVKLDTRSPQAEVMLAMTQLRLKNYDKALAAATNLEKRQADNPLAQNLKGAAYLGKQDFAHARESFEKALTLQPSNFPAALNLAQLDLKDKKPELAKKRFETMLVQDKKNIQIMTALSNLAMSQGQTREATDWLETASRENPDALEPSLQLIAHYLRTGDKKQALTLAKRLEGSNSTNPTFLDLLAQAQFANDDKTASLETYKKLATARPDSPLALMRIATLNMAIKNYPDAAEALKKALALQADFLEAQLALASVDVSMGHADQALVIARQIQKQNHLLPAGFELEGNLLMQQKKPEQAAKSFEQALTLAQNGSVLVKLHAAMTQAGQGKSADSRLSGWLKAHPADIPTRMYQAGIYLGNKQNKPAIEQYQQVLAQAPDYVPALNNLAWLYQQEKDERALQLAEKANRLAPDNPATLDTLGTILVEQGNTTGGLPLLEKAASRAPLDADIHYHLALGLFKSGDKVRARKELDQLLSSGKEFSSIADARALLKQL